MRPIRRITVIVLLAVFLIPGLLQARAPVGFWERAGVSGPDGLFNTVRNLLAFFWPNSGSGSLTKDDSGGALDPSGSPKPGPSGMTTEGESGGALDPSGQP